MNLHDILIDTGSLLHVSCTGAGARLLQRLWETPGGSRYLVGTTPYGHTQLRSFLGFASDGSSVSLEVAIEMAMASYVQAAELRSTQELAGSPVGLGLTAAVASDRLPRGEQRAHLAVVARSGVRAVPLPLRKDSGIEARRRHDEAIAEAALGLLRAAVEGADAGVDASADAVEALFARPVFELDGTRSEGTSTGLHLPATLNPLHAGHRAMLCAAEREVGTGARGSYLVTTTSVHKPPLSVPEMLDRVGMARAERWHRQARAIEFSRNDPLFVDKARQRPGSTFVIGADTMARMLDPCWGPSRDQVLTDLRNHRATFLVMGRRVEGRWLTCRDIPVPFPFGLLFRLWRAAWTSARGSPAAPPRDRPMPYTYEYPRPGLTVDCVVFAATEDGLKLLLIERAGEPFKGRHALPGGFVDMAETTEEAARRELREETGLETSVLEQLYTFSRVDRDPRERVVSVAYFTLVRPSAVTAGDDAASARWYDARALPPLAFDHEEIVSLALDRLRAKTGISPSGSSFLPPKVTLGRLQIRPRPR